MPLPQPPTVPVRCYCLLPIHKGEYCHVWRYDMTRPLGSCVAWAKCRTLGCSVTFLAPDIAPAGLDPPMFGYILLPLLLAG
jgi:hypothetical protein